MQLIINHLTRMQPGYFCAAGIEPKSGLHVRPILETGLKTALLLRNGGPFELGATLEFGLMRFIGHTPEIEDRLFDANNLRVVEPSNVPRMLELSLQAARTSLTDIFTTELHRVASTFGILEHRGLYSLGCYWVAKPTLKIVDDGESQRLKLNWIEHGHQVAVAVADIRLFEYDHRRINQEAVQSLQQRLDQTERVLLSVGLSRPYRKTDQEATFHWLQVNNIHL